MKEIEVKILEIDKEKIIKKLESFGAKKIFDDDIISYFFDFPDNALEKKQMLFRLRSKGTSGELTLKKKISKEKAKINEETEVSVSDIVVMKKIIEALGMKTKYNHTKHRVSYLLGNVRFEIDTFKEIPTFLEIEADSIKTLHIWAVKLGFSKKDLKPWSERDLMQHYGKEKFK